ncbi:DNA polymerase I OS=Lysinibacillus sphaericus OX=1421 GN=polA PE=3 SV=1 [Lysinibacillus sphaericus]
MPFEVASTSDLLRRWLEDATKIKYITDTKAAQAALKRVGIRLAGVEFDLLLASYINNPALSGDDVADTCKGFRLSRSASK